MPESDSEALDEHAFSCKKLLMFSSFSSNNPIFEALILSTLTFMSWLSAVDIDVSASKAGEVI